MGAIEEKLKLLINSRYKSLRDFVNKSGVGIPYTTIDGMLKRDIKNASITNVISLCFALGISADELAKGNIVPIDETDNIQKYARKLAALPPEQLKTALTFIEFLSTEGGGEK